MPSSSKGPRCTDCGALPDKLEEKPTPQGIDLGQGQDYKCTECGNEFTALRRYFYNRRGEQVRSPGDTA